VLLLAIDTSTLCGSVAVVRGAAAPDAPAVTVLGRAAAAVTTHSEMLLGLVAEALRQAGVAPGALEAVGCGAGPGSFTGLRIGLSTAKGLCLATGAPLVMASSLRALALQAAPQAAGAIVIAVLDAKKGEVYGGFYRGPAAAPTSAEVALPPAAFARHAAGLAAGVPVWFCGDRGGAGAADLQREVLQGRWATAGPGPGTPGAVEVARLCLERLATDGPADLASAVPTYLRPSEAELKRGGPGTEATLDRPGSRPLGWKGRP
jgi:tRNA threonylcarbamoyladenosine biosynthesis protein TsaB